MKAGATGEVSGNGTTNWADTRFLCLPGNVTQPGSRDVADANANKSSTSGAVRRGNGGGSAAWVGGVVVASVLVGLL